MSHVSLIVLKLGAEDPLDRIVDMLRRRRDVDLAIVTPIALGDAREVLQAKRDLDVLLIIGPQAEIGEATEFARDLHPDLLIVTVAVETGRTNLTLPDPNFDELGEVIVALGQAWKRAHRSGKILNFGAWLPRRQEEPQSRPLVVEREVAPANVHILAEALAWVEKATTILLENWSARKDEVPGFATSWETLERWLASFGNLASTPAEPAERLFTALEKRLSEDEGRGTPLGIVADTLGRDPVALKLFLITVAGELDMRFHRLFGALHDDFSRRRPSLGLASAIIAAATRGATPLDIRATLAVLERLRRLGLALPGAATNSASDEPLLARAEVVDWLFSGDVRQLVGAAAPLIDRAISIEAIELIPGNRIRQLRRMVRQKFARLETNDIAAVLLGGSEPGWLAVEAAAIDTAPLLAGAPKPDLAPGDLEQALTQLAVITNLTRQRLCLDLSGAGADGGLVWPMLEALLDRFEQPPFVVVDNPAQMLISERRERLAIVEFPALSQDDRRQAIAKALAVHRQDDADLAAALADRFPIAPAALPRAVTLALAAAAENGRPTQPTQPDWYAGFRRAAGARLPQLARRVEPEGDDPEQSPLDRVIIPKTQRNQLDELVRHVRFGARVLDDWGYAALLDGKGVAALFSGESGTGKTTAAHAIASALESDLYVIELSQVVSKYIGETEKNLEIVFSEAQAAGAVLLFDEADALFGKRSAVTTAHDRYANIEVAYLLQRLQRFTGLAILTTNNAANIDSAFARRLQFRVEFPRPGPPERLEIWQQSLLPKLRADEFDLKRLAVSLDVTGGAIRQMAFHAAIRAAEQSRLISWDDVVAGARSQLLRLGQYEDLAKLDGIAASSDRKVA